MDTNFQIILPDHFKVGIYAMNDASPSGVHPVDPDAAWQYNQSGHGIFWTLNEFKGQRLKENLVNILRWGVDIDDGTKQEQIDKIRKAPIPPSEVNETKRGYQVCYYAKEASPKYWNSIVVDRLVPYFGGDRRARDLCRIFRVPGFLHNKDVNNPFRVNCVSYHPERIYSEKVMANLFEDVSAADRKEFNQRMKKDIPGSEDFFTDLFNTDHVDLLNNISGTEIVRGDTYTFKKQSNGNMNIWSNGKSTSTFVDRQGRIGSLDGGGPTLIQWLMWYGHSKGTAINFAKKELQCLNSTK